MLRITGLAVVSALALAPPVAAQEERFSAWAVSMGNIATGSNAQVDIVINRWSSDAERERLVKAFVDKGQDELLKQLQKIKPPVGRFNVVGQLGWDIQFAREVKGEDGGRRIFIATDRKISFREAASNTRTMDYPFTLIELRLDQNGEGEGRASIMTKITWNKKKDVLELENYSSEPVRLQQVRQQK